MQKEHSLFSKTRMDCVGIAGQHPTVRISTTSPFSGLQRYKIFFSFSVLLLLLAAL